MKCIREIAPGIFSVGASDRRLALFENLFPLENGVTYNSFLILGEKTALVDTVDASVSRQFFENVAAGLGGRKLDYLVVNHMEPDHCATIAGVCALHPEAKIVGNKKTFTMTGQFFREDLSSRFHEVKEGDTLDLGGRALKFLTAPMVHWPEVMMAVEAESGILFSADAFGTFGAFDGNVFSDELDYEGLYLDESRRYYANIVGKFGAQTAAVMMKLGGVVPPVICPLHGPLLRGDTIRLLLKKYALWASYAPEKAGAVVAYASMYGNTESAALAFADMLGARGVADMRVFDVSKTHCSWVIANIFKYSHLVLAAPTYNMHVHQSMEILLRDMAALNVQNRKAAIIGNGSWAPAAPKLMAAALGEMKGMELVGDPLVILSSMKDAQIPEMEALADRFMETMAR